MKKSTPKNLVIKNLDLLNDSQLISDLKDDITFADLFDMDEMQHVQDTFAAAAGISSVITSPQGTPLTKPSNFCALCTMIRSTKIGNERCIASDKKIVKINQETNSIHPCFSAGLLDTGVSIYLGKKHIANWLIGQVLDYNTDKKEILKYADTIGIDRIKFSEALDKVTVMSSKQLSRISDTLFLFANEMAKKAYQNLAQKKLILELQQQKDLLIESKKQQEDTEKELFFSKNKIALKNDISTSIILNDNKDFFNLILEIILKNTKSEYGLFGYISDNTLVCPAHNFTSEIDKNTSNSILKYNKSKWTDIWEDSFITKSAILKNKTITIPNSQITIDHAISIPILHKEEVIGLLLLGNKSEGYNTETQDLLNEIATYISPLLYSRLKELKNKEELNIAQKRAQKSASELNKQERLFQTMFNTIKESIIITDIERQIIMANTSVKNVFGYKAEELIGQSIINLYPDKESYDRMGELFFKPTSKQNDSDYVQTPYLHKDKHVFQGEVFGTKLFDQNKEWIGNIAVSHDITERLKAFNDLKNAKLEAEESSRLKTEFINNMSHEIRTPMNGIIGFSDMLSNKGLSDDKRNYFVKIIQSSSEQLLKIIDDILEISILETNKLKVNNSEVCLNHVFMSIYSNFDNISKEHRVPLYLQKTLNDQQSTFTTDKTKLEKIISNLISNSIKYTQEGSIELGYYTQDSSIYIYVKDTGTGIAKENHQLIFKRFAQAEKNISQKRGGLGLGLSISEANAILLGGTISVKSELGKGATFTLKLPFTQKELEKEKVTAISHSINSDKFTILIAEDEEVNFLYYEAVLDAAYNGKQILIHALNGQEAIDICLERNDIDLVLMDIKMPIVNGYQATKKIKAVKPDLTIIAQTAYSTEADINEAYNNGCDDFISKPINKNDLIQVINKYIDIDSDK